MTRAWVGASGIIAPKVHIGMESRLPRLQALACLANTFLITISFMISDAHKTNRLCFFSRDEREWTYKRSSRSRALGASRRLFDPLQQLSRTIRVSATAYTQSRAQQNYT
ncbi:hypothetical protein BDR03DRAFT_571386 [Suillus americanus]|nr:hypothetical protein BDR03DRAFT_571386 [Suillus americanus]